MTHLGLFEGIGGFSLAAKWSGINTIAWCEIDLFCQQVLKYHFPNAESFTDIKKSDFSAYANKIDILTGGFPCQPYSTAGKRKGKNDERHLWPEMFRAIREIKPKWVVGENVRGIVNWGRGLVFEEIQADLEAFGYEVITFILPACAVNAPHRRDRVWFVANRNMHGRNGSNGENEVNSSERGFNAFSNIKQSSKYGFITNTNGIGLRGESNWIGKSGFPSKNDPGDYWQNFPTQSPVCNGDDGFSDKLDNITFSKWRKESIKAAGNAIVPHIAYEIFQAILKIEKI